MHLETLKVFCDLAETKSFSKAAQVNGITQSAVSQQVRALELRYKVSLVERNRKACGLTAEGRKFLNAARGIVDAYRAIGEQLRSSSGEISGHIRLGSELGIGLYELPPRLASFRESHPGVEVFVQYLRTSKVYESVAASEVDLGFVAFPQARPGLKFEVFDEDQLVVICHPENRLAERTSVELAALGEENCVGYGLDAPIGRFIERELRKNRVDVTFTMHFDDIETVKRAVEINSGIALVPENTVKTEVATGALVAIPLKGARLVRPMAVVFKASRPRSVAVQAFFSTISGETSVPPNLAAF
jgi:LysR family transcriptional regulator, transcriptional activator of the cysJI operon